MIELIPLTKPITASIAIPGSKSYTNRVLLMAAMTEGSVTLANCLISDDTRAMMSALQTLGITIEEKGTTLIVKGDYHDIKMNDYTVNCNISGITMRFLTAFCCVIPGVKNLTGEDGLLERPIKELVDGLQQLGAEIEYLRHDGFPPIRITTSSLEKHQAKLSGDISSQYFSALMMIAPLVNGLEILVDGNQISKPYIDMTIDTMKSFNVEVINDNYKRYHIEAGQAYQKDSYTVEGDYSSAGYFFALAALTNSSITVTNLNPKSKQADIKLLSVLKEMGAEIETGPDFIKVTGKEIKPINVDMEDFPDQAQTLAVLCAFAKGTSHLTGIRSLRVKETERAQALVNELGKMDIKVDQTHDSLTIHGGDPKAATIDTYGDHRMAMSFAIAGTILPGLKINNPEVVTKTFPTFWHELKKLGIESKEI